MALVWTGRGRAVPRVVPRPGSVVHRELVAIVVAEWQGYAACGEDILPHELSTAIDAEADRRRRLAEGANAARPMS
jgi:hypothetical protein